VKGITYAFSSQEYHNIACQISLEGFIPAEDIKHCEKWVTFIGSLEHRTQGHTDPAILHFGWPSVAYSKQSFNHNSYSH